MTSNHLDRRNFLKYAGVSIAATHFSGFMSQAAFAQNERPAGKLKPNILLITSEDNGPHLSCYGDPYVKTPNLDKLAAQGVQFTNAYVSQAGCSPSRSSIFTGLYTHQNGQIGLATHNLRMYRPDMPNIFRSLKENGYTTGIIGKIHVNPESAFPLDYHNPMGSFEQRDVRKEAEAAAEFIRENADKPFILMINYKDAHRKFFAQRNGLPAKPLTAEDVKPLPEIGLDSPELRKQTANYYNCMSRLDSGIQMLMEKLDQSGQRDNTLVIYLGDHGEDILRGKRTSYEGGVKIPLIMNWPKKIDPGQVRKELVSTIDFFPTLLDITGAKPVDGLPGMSLKPLFKNKPVKWRNYLFTEYHLHSGHNFYPQRTVRDKRYKLILNLLHGQVNPGYGFTNKRFFKAGEIDQLIKSSPNRIQNAYKILHTAPEYELYDLQNDPYEFNNLAELPEYKDQLDNLKAQLAAWRKKTKDPLLDPDNLKRLKAEVDSCWDNGEYEKKQHWDYPDYFFPKLNKNTNAT